MPDHGKVVTEQYLAAKNQLDEAWYDEVLREEPYYENDDTPLGHLAYDDSKGRMVGEVDIWLLNRNKDLMMPIEVKTGYKDVSYGRDQLDRVDDYFEDWEVLKKLVLEP